MDRRGQRSVVSMRSFSRRWLGLILKLSSLIASGSQALVACNPIIGVPCWAGTDINSDHLSDVVLYNTTPGQAGGYSLISNGQGTFPSSTSFGAGAGYDIVRIGDFNGDGKMDVLF